MQNKHSQLGFFQSVLPWVMGALGLVVYLVTINHWVSIRSLPIVARVTGWDWSPFVQMPLLYFLTFPFRWLPAGVQPVALNILSAVFAALTLAFLARSVMLLPHDRTHEQRLRERNEFSLFSTPAAWVPPVFAALALMFQMTMWENSTAQTGESLDLLLFAYLIRCLLEFRVGQKERWLTKFALVYGLGITNNYSLIAYIPAFLGALIWIRGKAFFNAAFLGRTVALWCFGLLAYFALPLVWQLRGDTTYSFLDILRANIAAQKMVLTDPALRSRVFILSLTSVLPVVMMGIRWPSSFGETSASGAAITNIMFRLVHIVFFVAGAVTMLDPKFSPRNLGWGLPFLSLYYLTAIAVGYYGGYVLLVFTDPAKKSWQRQSQILRFFNPFFRAIVWVGLVAIPTILVAKNFPFAKASNGSLLREFAKMSSEAVSADADILLSEDPYQLSMLEGWTSRDGSKRKHMLINTRMLELPNYHKQLAQIYGNRWPALLESDQSAKTVPQMRLLQIMTDLARTNRIVYLHPSFGYYFENFYPVPHGIVYSMQVYSNKMLLPPNVTAPILAENEAFWKGMQGSLSELQPLVKKDVPDARYVGAYYSRAMNTWGVELQKLHRTADAAQFFADAMELNTNNIPALVNFQFNQQAFAGKAQKEDLQKEIEEKFGRYRSWEGVMGDNGPFDEPEFCAKLGAIFENQSLPRQALEQYTRASILAPTNFTFRSASVNIYLTVGRPDKVFELVSEARSQKAALNRTNQMELIAIEAAAYFAQTNYAKAEELLTTAIEQNPRQRALLETLSELYKASHQPDKALEVLDRMIADEPNSPDLRLQKADIFTASEDYSKANAEINTILQKDHDNVPALLYRAYVFLQMKEYKKGLAVVEEVEKLDPKNQQAILYRGPLELNLKEFDKAVDSFTKILNRDPGNVWALRNRSMSSLQSGRLDIAEKDYDSLKKMFPTKHWVYYGLGEIAYRRKDKQDAIKNYELYMKYAPIDASDKDLTADRKQVSERLDELKKVASR